MCTLALNVFETKILFGLSVGIKRFVYGLLLFLIAFGCVALWFGFRTSNPIIVSAGLGAIQVAVVSLVSVAILTNLEGKATQVQLEEKRVEFLKEYIPSAASRISIRGSGPRLNCNFLEDRDIYGGLFEMRIGTQIVCRFWVGVNVFKLSVVFFVRPNCSDSEDPVEVVQEIFRYSMGGAEAQGYSVNFEAAHLSNETFVSIWCTVNADRDFLLFPSKKTFWSNDIAMMLQSLVRTGTRQKAHVSLITQAMPQPL